jgi:hypothetical protein
MQTDEVQTNIVKHLPAIDTEYAVAVDGNFSWGMNEKERAAPEKPKNASKKNKDVASKKNKDGSSKGSEKKEKENKKRILANYIHLRDI